MIYTKYFTSRVTPTISTTAYASGDVVGGLLTVPFTLARGGIINDIKVFDKSNQQVDLTVHLFEQSLVDSHTVVADNDALSLTHTDALSLIESVPLSSPYTSLGSTSYAQQADLNITFNVQHVYSEILLYTYIEAAGTPTYTANDDITLVIRGIGD